MSGQTFSAAPPSQITRVSSVIYRLLWLAGLPAAVYSFYQLQSQHNLGLSRPFAVVLGATSTILLALIYFDMDAIDRLENRDHDYPNWVGAGKKKEVALRVLIVLCLLFAVGELHLLQEMALWVVGHLQRAFGIPDNSFGPRILDFVKQSHIFVSGSFGAFACIALWNVGALFNRCRGFRAATASLQKGSAELARYLIVFPRIVVVVVLATICSLYWFLIWFYSGTVVSFAHTFVMIYSLCVAFVFLLRFGRMRDWVERKVTRILAWFAAGSN
jgi:hypothetical protein